MPEPQRDPYGPLPARAAIVRAAAPPPPTQAPDEGPQQSYMPEQPAPDPQPAAPAMAYAPPVYASPAPYYAPPVAYAAPYPSVMPYVGVAIGPRCRRVRICAVRVQIQTVRRRACGARVWICAAGFMQPAARSSRIMDMPDGDMRGGGFAARGGFAMRGGRGR